MAANAGSQSLVILPEAEPIACIGPGKNYWSLAIAELGHQEAEYIDFDDAGILRRIPWQTVLTEVKQAVEEKKVQFMDKRWAINRKDNRPIILREKLDKIAVSVEKFIQIGDCAVQYDPAHAALPWAGVRFVLKATIIDQQTITGVFDGMELISNLIGRYAIFEQLYLNTQLKTYTGLEKTLVELYKRVMEYLSKAKRFYSRSTAARLARNIILDAKGDFDSLLQRIVEQQREVDYYASLADAEYQDDVIRQVNTLSLSQRANFEDLKQFLAIFGRYSKDMHSKISVLHEHHEEQNMSAILEWLSPVPYIDHHNNIHKDRLEGSGLWLFRKQQYQDWRESSCSSILWLHGIPGSGKTTLLSLIIDHFQNITNFGSQSVAYFYCARSTSERERGNPEEILRSILRQLSCPGPNFPICQPVRLKYGELPCAGFRPRKLTLDESTQLILEVVKSYLSVTIILDALDECNQETLSDFISALKKIVQQSTSTVKVLVSSRASKDIVSQLGDLPQLRIQSHDNADDIKRFVDRRVEEYIQDKKLLGGDVSVQLKKHVIETLAGGAQGMFSWASLQLQSICGPGIIVEEDVREVLRHLPTDISNVYSTIYDRMSSQLGPKSRLIMNRALKWLLCAQRPLSADELLAALSVDPQGTFSPVSRQNILDMCYNLVIHDDEMDVFRFSHLSVQEYLEKQSEFSSIIAHSCAAEGCLAVLINPTANYESSKNDVARANGVLRKYSTVYWATHCEMSADRRLEGTLGRLFKQFVTGSLFEAWYHSAREMIQTMAWDDPLKAKIESALTSPESPPDPYFAACVWGFHDLVEQSLRSTTITLQSTNLRGNTGLRIASEYGQYDVVRLLLERGADVKLKDTDGATALHVAARTGNEKIAQLLVEQGADLGAVDENGRTPLHQAAEAGNKAVALLLLEIGGDINAQDNYGWTPLHCAAERGDETVIRMLMSRRADVETQDEYGCTALHLAVEQGHEHVARQLLEHGANMNVKNKHGWIVLLLAVDKQHEEVVRLLLEQGKRVGTKAGLSDALCWAAERGNERLLRLILDHGADIEATDSSGMRVLHRAAARGHEAVLRHLLQQGPQLESRDANGRTALYLAAKGGHETATRLLLDSGAKMTAKREGGKTPLQNCIVRGHVKMARLLLEYGADIEARDSAGRTAMHFAASAKNEAAMKLLLEMKAKMETTYN